MAQALFGGKENDQLITWCLDQGDWGVVMMCLG